MARIGVIINPWSGGNSGRWLDMDWVTQAAGPDSLVVRVWSLGELGVVVQEFQRQGVELVAIRGGDGTVTRVLTALLNTWRGPMPLLGLLGGGRKDFAAGRLGVDIRRPHRTLAHLANSLPLGGSWRIQRVPMRTMVLESPEHSQPVICLTFGIGLFCDFVQTLYQAGDSSSLGEIRTLSRLVMRSLIAGDQSQDFWRLVPTQVTIDGQASPFREYSIIMASTIAQAPLGLRPFGPTEPPTGKFSFLLSALSPSEYRSTPVAPFMGTYRGPQHQVGAAERLEFTTDGAYVFDGEIVEPRGRITVSLCAGPELDVAVPMVNGLWR